MKLVILAVAGLVASISIPEGSARQYQEPSSRYGEQRDFSYIQPNLLQEFINVSRDIQSTSSKGLQYYLANYGPLAKIVVTDFMDSFGLARNLQLAIPILAKLLVIVVFAAMQFQPSLLEFQHTARSAYIFLQNFNDPEFQIMNDITDRVFEVLDDEVITQ